MLTEIISNQHHYFVDEKGQLQGEYKSWHKNGQLCTYCFYVNGELHGAYRVYWDNGQTHIHCFYVNGDRHGEYKSGWYNAAERDHCFYVNDKAVSFDEIPYPDTPADRLYFTLKYGIPLLSVETTC